jgi:small subunit ribosomal protein SAe
MANNTAAPPRQLSQKEADIQMMLAAEVHLGTKNCDFQMERYVFKRRNDGISRFTFSDLSLFSYLSFFLRVF